MLGLIKKSTIRKVFGQFDIGITKKSVLETLMVMSKHGYDMQLLRALPEEHWSWFIKHLEASRSQIRQDLFVLSELELKRGGFFVEFGATNGVDLSNTYLLEKEFGWTGILAEPARCWHEELRRNRQAIIDERCVWKKTGDTLKFNEVDIAELSTINAYSSHDRHFEARQDGRFYDVKTVSLNDLLDEHGAPSVIDYLSIDTEGSEFEILESFDFGRHFFRVITCEHNHSPLRQKIFDLLTGHGYTRRLEGTSQFDDWYVRK